jgi:hypothetical protein
MMSVMSTGPGERSDSDDLCALAADRARARGHELGPWTPMPGEEAIARTASCTRCGRVAYVRFESALVGAAGPALTDSCDEPGEQTLR